MAQPIKFDWSNATLTAPDGMPGVGELPVHRGAHGVVTSAWQLSSDELQEIVANGGVVYLSVFSGYTQPPVFVGDERGVLSLVSGMIQNHGLPKGDKQ